MTTHALPLWKVSQFSPWSAVSQVNERWNLSAPEYMLVLKFCRGLWGNWTYLQISSRPLERTNDGMTSPPPITVSDCSSTTGLFCSTFLCNSTTLQHSSRLIHNTAHRVKTKTAAQPKPWALFGNLHEFHADALLLQPQKHTLIVSLFLEVCMLQKKSRCNANFLFIPPVITFSTKYTAILGCILDVFRRSFTISD